MAAVRMTQASHPAPWDTKPHHQEVVKLSYSLIKHGAEKPPSRKTYFIEDDGRIVETGLQWQVTTRHSDDDFDDSDEETLVAADDSGAASPKPDFNSNAKMDEIKRKLREDDLKFMAEVGLSGEEFAEYIAQADSFGSAPSTRSSGTLGAEWGDYEDYEDGDDGDDEESVFEVGYDDEAPLAEVVDVYLEDLSAPVEVVSEVELPRPTMRASVEVVEGVEDLEVVEAIQVAEVVEIVEAVDAVDVVHVVDVVEETDLLEEVQLRTEGPVESPVPEKKTSFFGRVVQKVASRLENANVSSALERAKKVKSASSKWATRLRPRKG
ncbi:Uu.00g053870.m01.CDS01 [Anthostomella pinea]|uniref:Uu.00g053870.m01.CDS01 n=1 Tax=Anthostomella pinea TaxID=933095 RepID=A0AAI8VWJ1_9PEZI|nr:Uu.00g053870.m01.CDS01 [Anthostomella pinea]